MSVRQVALPLSARPPSARPPLLARPPSARPLSARPSARVLEHSVSTHPMWHSSLPHASPRLVRPRSARPPSACVSPHIHPKRQRNDLLDLRMPVGAGPRQPSETWRQRVRETVLAEHAAASLLVGMVDERPCKPTGHYAKPAPSLGNNIHTRGTSPIQEDFATIAAFVAAGDVEAARRLVPRPPSHGDARCPLLYPRNAVAATPLYPDFCRCVVQQPRLPCSTRQHSTGARPSTAPWPSPPQVEAPRRLPDYAGRTPRCRTVWDRGPSILARVARNQSHTSASWFRTPWLTHGSMVRCRPPLHAYRSLRTMIQSNGWVGVKRGCDGCEKRMISMLCMY